METRVPYLNISDKQYKLIGLTWGLIFAAIFHYYKVFDQESYSIVRTFISTDFLLKAVFSMAVGYFISYYGFKKINKD